MKTQIAAGLLVVLAVGCGAPDEATCQEQLQVLRDSGQFGGSCDSEDGRKAVSDRYNALPVGDATGSKSGCDDTCQSTQ